MERIDLIKIFNHYSLIMYYLGYKLKRVSSLGYYFDSVHSPNNGELGMLTIPSVKSTHNVI